MHATSACRKYGLRTTVVATLLLLVALAPANAVAKTIFVDPSVPASSAADGSEAAPYHTLCMDRARIVAALQPGDVVLLAPGNHSCGSDQVRLDLVHDLTLAGSAGVRPTLAAPTGGASAYLGELLLIGVQRIALRHVHVRGVIVEDWAGPSYDVLIEECLCSPRAEEIASWITPADYTARTMTGISLTGGGRMRAVRNHILYCKRCIIANNDTDVIENTVEFSIGDGYRVGGSDVSILRNVYLGALAVDDDHRDMLQVFAGRTTISNLTIAGNVFSTVHPRWIAEPSTWPKFPGYTAGDSQGVSAFDDIVLGLTMVNNVLLVNHHHGSTWNGLRGNSLIAYNTIVNPRVGFSDYIGTAWLRVDINKSADTVIMNNIALSYSPSALDERGILIANNYLMSRTVTAANYLGAVLVNATGLDARLTVASPALGGGRAPNTLSNSALMAQLPVVDVTGMPRSPSSADPGAFVLGAAPIAVLSVVAGGSTANGLSVTAGGISTGGGGGVSASGGSTVGGNAVGSSNTGRGGGSDGGLSAGAIAGTVIGAVAGFVLLALVIAALVALVVFAVMRSRNSSVASSTSRLNRSLVGTPANL